MFVKKSNVQVFQKPTCTIYEYGGTKNLDLAVAEIKDKYPEKGWARNKEVDETYFIISGSGRFYFENETFDITEGDLVLIEKGRWYRFEGNAKIVIACSPAWSVEQYEEKEE